MTASLAPPGSPAAPPSGPGAGAPAVAGGTAPAVTGPDQRRLRARVAELATTTPGRLRVESVAIIVLAVLAGLVTALVTTSRLADTHRITNEAVPVVVHARQVQTSLAEANAAAATAFLAGGVEDPGQRAIYEQSLATAATELEAATQLAGDDTPTRDALVTLTGALPRYAGLIETARANNRQGFPVSAAYLNDASRLLQTEAYPATDTVANQAAQRYRDAYDSQRGLSLALGAVAIALDLALVAALGYLMAQLNRRFRRTLNPPIAVGLALAVILTGWLAYGLVNQTSHLQTARTDSYAGTRLYLDARGIAFGAKADEARFLIARGAGQSFETSFQARKTQFDQLAPALSDHGVASARSAARLDSETTLAQWAAYLAIHAQLVQADATDRTQSVALAQNQATAAFNQLDQTTGAALSAEQAQFRAEMDRAGNALRGIRYGALLLVLAIAAAAAYGLQLRINEYR